MDHSENNGLAEQLREVRAMLRATMNGPVSASLREQGLGYRLIFGTEQPRLAAVAEEVRGLNADDAGRAALAAALWKEDCRECRLLAAMTMPAAHFAEDLADVWIEQLNYAEEAQALAMHLLAAQPYAADLAFRLVAAEQPLRRLTGWLMFGRLFTLRAALRQRDADELLDHARAELLAGQTDAGAPAELRRTVCNTLLKYMDLGEAEAARGERLLDSLGA